MAVDASYLDFEDSEGLCAAARASRADGFTGMLAIHPGQVETINLAFTPTQAEIQEARDIIAAFDASPGVGSLQFNGRMIDKPHLKLARRMLGIAAEERAYGAGQRAPILRPA
jgi:citrate lyase subunit beta / citryl-CoA lyase